MDEGGPNLLSELFDAILALATAIWEQFWEIAPIVFKFLLLVLFSLIVLPCTYIAGNLYEPWVKWGEKI